MRRDSGDPAQIIIQISLRVPEEMLRFGGPEVERLLTQDAGMEISHFLKQQPWQFLTAGDTGTTFFADMDTEPPGRNAQRRPVAEALAELKTLSGNPNFGG